MRDTEGKPGSGMSRFKLYRGLHVLAAMTTGQEEMAFLLGVTRQAIAAALDGKGTRIELDDVKRAARAVAIEHHGRKDKLPLGRWAFIEMCLASIDPHAEMLTVKAKREDGIPVAVRKHLEAHTFRSLGYTVKWFARQGYRKQYIRQVIKRLITKEPQLAYRTFEDISGTEHDPKNRVKDPINKVQIECTEAELDDAWAGKYKKRSEKSVNKAARRIARKVKATGSTKGLVDAVAVVGKGKKKLVIQSGDQLQDDAD